MIITRKMPEFNAFGAMYIFLKEKFVQNPTLNTLKFRKILFNLMYKNRLGFFARFRGFLEKLSHLIGKLGAECFDFQGRFGFTGEIQGQALIYQGLC